MIKVKVISNPWNFFIVCYNFFFNMESDVSLEKWDNKHYQRFEWENLHWLNHNFLVIKSKELEITFGNISRETGRAKLSKCEFYYFQV